MRPANSKTQREASLASPQKRINFDVFDHAQALTPKPNSQFKAPLFGSYVPAGFPSPAMDYKEESLDLNELCIQHPSATYYVRASGESMLGAGIHNHDILVVDRSMRAQPGHIVVAALNGEFTVKVLQTNPRLCLEPRNELYSTIEVSDADEFDIFGVVTFVIHSTLA